MLLASHIITMMKVGTQFAVLDHHNKSLREASHPV